MTEKKYIRQVTGKLLCSRKKKDEIRRELESDIHSALEQGEALEEILSRMGSPRTVAEEFNAVFPEAEQKAAKRRKRLGVTFSIAVVAILLILLAVWCLPRTKEIGDSRLYREEELSSRITEVIDLWDADDMEGLCRYFNGELKESVTPEELSEAKRQVSADWGERGSFGTPYMTEITQMGQTMAVVQISAAYEQVNVTYTITFDENMELAGFYVK